MSPEFAFRVVASSNCLFPKERANGRVNPDSLVGLTRLLSGESIFFGGYLFGGLSPIDKLRQNLSGLGFPRPHALEICLDPQDKFRSLIYSGLQTSKDFHLDPGRLKSVLVDREVSGLVIAAGEMATREAGMRERMRDIVLVGFGPQAEKVVIRYRRLVDEIGLRTLSLPSWNLEEVDRLRETIFNLK